MLSLKAPWNCVAISAQKPRRPRGAPVGCRSHVWLELTARDHSKRYSSALTSSGVAEMD